MVQPTMTPPAMAQLTMVLPMMALINYFVAYNGTNTDTNNATMAPLINAECISPLFAQQL